MGALSISVFGSDAFRDGDIPSSSSFMLSPDEELELMLELMPELTDSPSVVVALEFALSFAFMRLPGSGDMGTKTFCTVATWFRFGWKTRVVIRAQGIG